MDTSKETQAIRVRRLRPADLEAVIRVDAATVGRRRDEYFRIKLEQNLAETGIEVSLAAEAEGRFAGFLLARIYYGEFGSLEPAAVLDTLSVHPDLQQGGVGRALLAQLRTNLLGLGVKQLRTEVSWDAPQVLAFFQRERFQPAARFCLDLDLETHRRLDDERAS